MNGRKDRNLRELLGEARAIHFAMIHGELSYLEAKNRTKPLLQEVNLAIDIIAKKYKKKPKYIKFIDLGSRF
jgi:hypothetical protein